LLADEARPSRCAPDEGIMKNRRGIMPSILATKLRFAFLIILIAAVANADVRHRAVGKRCGALPPGASASR